MARSGPAGARRGPRNLPRRNLPEALAQAVLERRDVRLARELLENLGGPHAARRAIELAELILVGAVEQPADVTPHR